MNLPNRIDLLAKLGEHMLSTDPDWKAAQEKAYRENGWFIPEFMDIAIQTIAYSYLRKEALTKWTAAYDLPDENERPKIVGIVMAGNIPLVGFHDLLCVFITGHRAVIKLSSKDETLLRHLVDKLIEWDPRIADLIRFSEMLKKCDAYIATGSNNSAGYFDYYFGKYPHVIRRNRTSVAILDGTESPDELSRLADDIYRYFGLGCRNVTQLYVPEGYDFVPLLGAFSRYNWLADHNKYKNNYDYNLALLILNKQFYMSNPSLLLSENSSPFSPISQLHYQFYTDRQQVISNLEGNPDIQCIAGKGHLPFGTTQQPTLTDYADGVDTMAFLAGL